MWQRGCTIASNRKEVLEATIEIDVPAAAEAGIALEEWDNVDELSWSNSKPTLMRDASFASATDRLFLS